MKRETKAQAIYRIVHEGFMDARVAVEKAWLEGHGGGLSGLDECLFRLMVATAEAASNVVKPKPKKPPRRPRGRGKR